MTNTNKVWAILGVDEKGNETGVIVVNAIGIVLPLYTQAKDNVPDMLSRAQEALMGRKETCRVAEYERVRHEKN